MFKCAWTLAACSDSQHGIRARAIDKFVDYGTDVCCQESFLDSYIRIKKIQKST